MAERNELEDLFTYGVKDALARAIAAKRRGLRLATPLALAVFAAWYAILSQAPWLFRGDGREAAARFATVLFSLVPAFLVWHYAPRALAGSARRGFTETVLRPVARLIDPAMRYTPGGRITREILDRSLLYDSGGEGMTTIRGDSLFEGTAADGQPFAFSTLDADKKVRHGCHLYGGTLFSGMFLWRAARETVTGLIMAVPRSSGLTAEGLTERIRAAGREELLPVREVEVVHDPEFVRWFIVLAAGGETAPPSPPARERMLSLLERYPCQPYYCREGNAWYMGLMTGRPHLQIPAVPPDGEAGLLRACQRYYDDIALLRRLADDDAFR